MAIGNFWSAACWFCFREKPKKEKVNKKSGKLGKSIHFALLLKLFFDVPTRKVRKEASDSCYTTKFSHRTNSVACLPSDGMPFLAPPCVDFTGSHLHYESLVCGKINATLPTLPSLAPNVRSQCSDSHPSGRRVESGDRMGLPRIDEHSFARHVCKVVNFSWDSSVFQRCDIIRGTWYLLFCPIGASSKARIRSVFRPTTSGCSALLPARSTVQSVVELSHWAPSSCLFLIEDARGYPLSHLSCLLGLLVSLQQASLNSEARPLRRCRFQPSPTDVFHRFLQIFTFYLLIRRGRDKRLINLTNAFHCKKSNPGFDNSAWWVFDVSPAGLLCCSHYI